MGGSNKCAVASGELIDEKYCGIYIYSFGNMSMVALCDDILVALFWRFMW